MDPIPIEMRGLKFEELCAVPIEWRMLTSIRPKSKLDEEYFNRFVRIIVVDYIFDRHITCTCFWFTHCFRLIELRKAELRTKARDKREYAKKSMIRKTKNRSGVTETRIVSCSECGEEYCDGQFYYFFLLARVQTEHKNPVVHF